MRRGEQRDAECKRIAFAREHHRAGSRDRKQRQREQLRSPRMRDEAHHELASCDSRRGRRDAHRFPIRSRVVSDVRDGFEQRLEGDEERCDECRASASREEHEDERSEDELRSRSDCGSGANAEQSAVAARERQQHRGDERHRHRLRVRQRREDEHRRRQVHKRRRSRA